MGCYCMVDASCSDFGCGSGGGGGGIALGGSCTPCYETPAPVCDIPVSGCGSPGALDTSPCSLDPCQVGNPCYQPYGSPCDVTLCTETGTYKDACGNVIGDQSTTWVDACGNWVSSDPMANGPAQSGETDPLTGQSQSTSPSKSGSNKASGGTPSNGGGGSMGAGKPQQANSAQQNSDALHSLMMAISRMGQSVGQMATRLAQTTNTALTGAKNRAAGTGSQSDLLILLVIAAIIIGGIVFTRSEASE